MATTKLNTTLRNAIVMQIMQDVPKLAQKDQAAVIQAALTAAMTPAMRKLVKTCPAALKTTRLYSSDHLLEWSTEFIIADLTSKDMDVALAPIRAQAKARRDAEQALNATLSGFTTVEGVLKAMPEFEKYLKNSLGVATTKNLPALANVVADLSKLGWPKGAAKAAK